MPVIRQQGNPVTFFQFQETQCAAETVYTLIELSVGKAAIGKHIIDSQFVGMHTGPFEHQLADHGCILLKFWIHISKEEQFKRFKAREEEPHKQHKITEDDWRNRDRWQDYEFAVDQMISRTSTRHAPWTLVSGNNKPYARIQILKTFCKTMKQALE